MLSQIFAPHSLALFFLYFATFALLWAVFTRAYVATTPWNEAEDIKAGKMAPAIALVGAELGFMIPFGVASWVGGTGPVGYVAFVAWGAMSGFVQLALFKLMYWRWPKGIDTDNKAVATLYAGASVCAGLGQAFSMIP